MKGAQELMEKWRYETWTRLYSTRPYGPQGLLTDTVVTALASKARLSTIEDLVSAGWGASRAKKHGDEVLQLLKAYDERFSNIRETEKRERMQAKKLETAQRNEAKRQQAIEDRALKRKERESQPKAPRPSRAKRQKMLAPSTAPNDLYTPPGPLTTMASGNENIPSSSHQQSQSQTYTYTISFILRAVSLELILAALLNHASSCLLQSAHRIPPSLLRICRLPP